MSKLTYKLGAFALAAAMMAVSANAALITYGIRAIGVTGQAILNSGTDVTVQNAGDTVILQIYADITNNDGNAQNDGFINASTAILSKENAGGVNQGNLGNGAVGNGTYIALGSQMAGATSVQPAQAVLDGGGLDLGANTGTSGYAVFGGTNAPAETFGTGPTTGAPAITEFILGTTTWTTTTAGNNGVIDFSTVQLNLLEAAGASGAKFNFENDGSSHSLHGSDANIALGGGVIIHAPVPEPATIGILGMALAGLALRRRRNVA